MKKVVSKKLKKVTMDDLATMVAKGFESMDTKLEKRFDEIEKDINDFKSEVDQKFKGVDANFKSIDQNFKDVRHDISGIGDRFPSNYMFDQLSLRVHKLEQNGKIGKK